MEEIVNFFELIQQVYFRPETICENETRAYKRHYETKGQSCSFCERNEMSSRHFYVGLSGIFAVARWRTQIFICGIITAGRSNGSSATIRNRWSSVFHNASASTRVCRQSTVRADCRRARFRNCFRCHESCGHPSLAGNLILRRCRLHIHRSGDNERSRAIFDHG